MIKTAAEMAKSLDDTENDDENLDSVSCYGTAPIASECPVSSPSISIVYDNIQTRIIPCKYAVRGTCSLGDKCLYLHDGKIVSLVYNVFDCFVQFRRMYSISSRMGTTSMRICVHRLILLLVLY